MTPDPHTNDGLDGFMSRAYTAVTDSPLSRKTRASESRSESLSPQGLKSRIASLEKTMHGHTEELVSHRNEFQTLRKTKDKSEEVSETHLRGMEKNLMGELERLRDDFSKTINEHKAELGRLSTQLRSLKAEKTVIQNQVAALQRRILTIDEEIGHE